MTSEMTPVATNLNKTGTDVSRTLEALAPFSREGIPAFKSLGQTADVGTQALEVAEPDDRAAGRLHRRRGQPVDQPREAAHEPARRERHQEPDGPDLQRDALDQRVRRARALPAHDAAGGLQLARDGREPGLYRELHQGRERRKRVEERTQAAHRAREDPGGRGSREGAARLRAPAARREAARGAVAAGRRQARGRSSRRRQAAGPGGQPQDAAPADPDEAVLDYLLGGEK